MNASNTLARIFVVAIILAAAGCADVTPPSSIAVKLNATAERPTASRTYQWVDFGMGAHQYDYPKSTAPTRKRVDLYDSGGECSSGTGTFWTVNIEGEAAEEYSYNGKYIRDLIPMGSAEYFNRCAVSVSSGDIAFTASHQIVIFKGGSQSKLTAYPVSQTPAFAGYDPSNNLYVDASGTNKAYALLELAVGGTSFQNVSLPNELRSSGSVQWDGNYVAVTDNAAGKIFRYSIAGYAATLEGTVVLKGRYPCEASWIAAPYVFCTGSGKKAAFVYKYPAGGKPITVLAGFGGSIVQVSK